MSTCDVCEAQNVEVSRLWVTGIETFACAKCRGETRTAPAECTACFNEDDCSQIEICRAIHAGTNDYRK